MSEAVEAVRYAIIGAGVSGLAFAAALQDRDYLVLERDDAIGGYCKTVAQDGFTWDYSGHFFHFRRPAIEAWLRDRMPGEEILTVQKSAKIYYGDRWIDFPFQKNIHQLPQAELLACLHDLYFRDAAKPVSTFQEMLISRFGEAICEKFLIPYNEKLYACDLNDLDADAMGRFFPHAELGEIIANFRQADNASYNATFTYPRGGAIQYVRALYSAVEPSQVCTGDGVVAIDAGRRTLRTASGRVVRYERLITSAPFDRLMGMLGRPVDPAIFSSNKVHVYNLGFDAKGPEGVHWLYVPQRERCFYRVGFYDNIFNDPRMSLYVEVGARTGDAIDDGALQARVMEDLRACGIVTDQRLVSRHSVTLDPAYVHVRAAARERFAALERTLQAWGIYPVGRYGAWTYCSIEDNIAEAWELAGRFNAFKQEG